MSAVKESVKTKEEIARLKTGEKNNLYDERL